MNDIAPDDPWLLLAIFARDQAQEIRDRYPAGGEFAAKQVEEAFDHFSRVLCGVTAHEEMEATMAVGQLFRARLGREIDESRYPNSY